MKIDDWRDDPNDVVITQLAPGLTKEQVAWIAETERLLDDLQRRVDAGEEIDFSGWLSENWLNKVTPDIG